MKKNLMSVVILALVLANFVLTGLLVFTIIPETRNANKMIEAVCAAIDLELSSGVATGTSNIPIDQIETFQINDGEPMTMNLASDDGKNHYVVVSIALSMNIKSDGYKEYGGATGLQAKEAIIKNNINTIVRKYTKTEFDENMSQVQNAILADMQSLFGSDFVVGVNFAEVQTE